MVDKLLQFTDAVAGGDKRVWVSPRAVAYVAPHSGGGTLIYFLSSGPAGPNDDGLAGLEYLRVTESPENVVHQLDGD